MSLGRVEVYRNLHTGTWSVRALDGPNKGRVIDHPTVVRVDNAKLVVQPGGRAKVLAEKRKNVHAFVRGDMVWSATGDPKASTQRTVSGTKVSYNPYRNETFVSESGHPVHEADAVVLDVAHGVFILPPG